MFLRWLSFFLSAGLCLLVLSCEQPSTTSTTQHYIFLGHPYDWRTENRLDPRLELLDYSRFSGVWLGGDVCARTSKSATTLTYLDSIFGLKQPQNHWAWGNHDLLEGDEQLLLAATQRPSYYTHWQNGLQIVVLNTNLFWHHPWPPAQENCAAKAAQVEWLIGVLDTIQAASQLVLLHHHGLFNEYKQSSKGDTLLLDNVRAIPVRPDCREQGDFSREIYPLLRRIRQAGTHVTSISGDVGMLSKGYAFMTEDSIQLLGSGINNSLDMDYPPDYVNNFEPDTVLLLNYDLHRQQLEWDFVRLSDLVSTHFSQPQWKQLPVRTQRLLEAY